MDLRGRLWALILQISFIMPLCRPSHPINSLCSNKGRDINVSQQLWANNEKIQSNSRCSAAAAMPDGNNSDWILIDSQYSSRVWWNALERGIKPICRLLSHSTFHTHTHTMSWPIACSLFSAVESQFYALCFSPQGSRSQTCFVCRPHYW